MTSKHKIECVPVVMTNKDKPVLCCKCKTPIEIGHRIFVRKGSYRYEPTPLRPVEMRPIERRVCGRKDRTWFERRFAHEECLTGLEGDQ